MPSQGASSCIDLSLPKMPVAQFLISCPFARRAKRDSLTAYY
jgi:hypothetical protein